MSEWGRCLHCGEEENHSMETRLVPGGELNFVVCGSCHSAATVMQWQHPVAPREVIVQSQTCLVCETGK